MGAGINIEDAGLRKLSTRDLEAADVKTELDFYQLSNGQSHLKFSSFGAHVVEAMLDGHQILYMSPTTHAAQDGTIAFRGGGPIIFPVLGVGTTGYTPAQKLSMHGIVRTRIFGVGSPDIDISNHISSIGSIDRSDAGTLQQWPHEYELGITQTLKPGQWITEYRVTNNGLGPMSFQLGDHTYHLMDAQGSRVQLAAGVYGAKEAGVIFMNGFNEMKKEKLSEAEIAHGIQVYGINRVFEMQNQPSGLIHICDIVPPAGNSTQPKLRIEVERMNQLVTWNPGDVQKPRIAEIPEPDILKFGCVEPVALVKDLPAGDTYIARRIITII